MEQNNNQETQQRRNPESNSNHTNVESGSGSDPASDSFQDNSHQPSSRLREFALWFHLPTYSTFRYGMITVYVGTLLMVIGYHNPWIAFTRYVLFYIHITLHNFRVCARRKIPVKCFKIWPCFWNMKSPCSFFISST